ncbi:MAG: hypothetical protein HZA89_13990 [Verrucomicrobia bacterium]|nr:hypothetical protein [Verrucomicrobiota bacterium]
MPREYDFHSTQRLAARAARELAVWLAADPRTVRVVNVEADEKFQALDVDLLWETRAGRRKIEIKADRHDQTDNFFFETESNREAGTPGCFLYTEADEVFYYFTGLRRLYVLPMPATRAWFTARLKRFREVTARTPVRGGFYTTAGRLVKIEEVMGAGLGATCHDLREFFQTPLFVHQIKYFLRKVRHVFRRPA